jgi:hypothetical protein
MRVLLPLATSTGWLMYHRSSASRCTPKGVARTSTHPQDDVVAVAARTYSPPREPLIGDYAEAMKATPPIVDDALVERLWQQQSDAAAQLIALVCRQEVPDAVRLRVRAARGSWTL